MERCKNCNAALEGPYCSQCGQKALAERLTVGYILRSFLEAITNLEQGFWYTFRRLMARPGQVVREYLAGKRRQYYHPVRYLIIMATFSALVTLVSGIYDLQQSEIRGLQEKALGVEPSKRQAEVQQWVQEESKKYLNLIVLLTLPFVSLASFRLFRKREYNYAEHLAINAFWTAQLSFIGLAMILVFLLFPGLALYFFIFSMLLSSLYYALGYRQLFDVSRGQALAKGLLANILGFSLMFITIMALTAIGVFVFVIIFKES